MEESARWAASKTSSVRCSLNMDSFNLSPTMIFCIIMDFIPCPLLWTLLTHGCSQECSVVSCCHSRSSLLPTPWWSVSSRTAILPPEDSKRRTENSSHRQMPRQQTRHPVALGEVRKQARYSRWCTQERRTRRRKRRRGGGGRFLTSCCWLVSTPDSR